MKRSRALKSKMENQRYPSEPEKDKIKIWQKHKDKEKV